MNPSRITDPGPPPLGRTYFATSPPAEIGVTQGGGALVIDDATGEVGQDWRQGGEPRPVCHLPIGRGSGAEGTVPKNPAADR